MDNIKELYGEHVKSPFPDLRGEEVHGIDLVMADADTAGLIQKYISNRGRLSETDLHILIACHSDLKVIVQELTGADRQYFARLQNVAAQIIEKLTGKSIAERPEYGPG